MRQKDYYWTVYFRFLEGTRRITGIKASCARRALELAVRELLLDGITDLTLEEISYQVFADEGQGFGEHGPLIAHIQKGCPVTIKRNGELVCTHVVDRIEQPDWIKGAALELAGVTVWTAETEVRISGVK